MRNPSDNFILTPREFFNYVDKNIQNIKVFFVSKEEVEKAKDFLEVRFNKAKLIPQTRSFHAFIPLHENTKEIRVKVRSFQESSQIFQVEKKEKKKKEKKCKEGKKPNLEL